MALQFPAVVRKETEVDLVWCLIGQSQVARDMRTFVTRAAGSSSTVLLLGETGSGKDHLAELINRCGVQEGYGGNFVTVDCGSVTEDLWESVMFGHAQGAFTDAHKAKTGLLEVADGGTLFFDEIGNMSLPLQARLLRIVEKKSYRPLGSNKEMVPHFRVVVATNANLREAVSKGTFRPDLYHRINVLRYVVPPLRARLEDIPLLAEYFLRSLDLSKSIRPSAMVTLMAYNWPGNVRELRNVMEGAAFNSDEDSEIEGKHIRSCFEEPTEEFVDLWGTGGAQLPTYEELQRRYFKECVCRTGGNGRHISSITQLTPRVLLSRLEEFGLHEIAESLRIEG